MVRVSPSDDNGLTVISEVNSAQILTIQKDRLSHRIGCLSVEDMKKVEEKLAYMLSLTSF